MEDMGTRVAKLRATALVKETTRDIGCLVANAMSCSSRRVVVPWREHGVTPTLSKSRTLLFVL